MATQHPKNGGYGPKGESLKIIFRDVNFIETKGLPVWSALILVHPFHISLYVVDMLVPKLLDQQEKDFENPQSFWQTQILQKIKLNFNNFLGVS
jgi:hypothetical protein